MEQVPTIFELSLLELLRRNVDVDNADPPLPRDLEKYIISYQMCKTDDLKYILAMQNQHYHIAKYYSTFLPVAVEIPRFQARELAYLLGLLHQVSNQLPYDEKAVKYLVDEQRTNLSNSAVLSFIIDMALQNHNVPLFKRAYEAYKLYDQEVSIDISDAIFQAARLNSEEMLRLLLPDAVGEEANWIVFLTDTTVIDRILLDYHYDVNALLENAMKSEIGTDVFVNHIRKNYK